MEKLLKLYEFQKIDMELYNLENAIKKSNSRKKLAKARNILLEGQKTAEQYEKDIENRKNDIESIMNGYKDLSKKVEQIVEKSAGIKEPEEAKEMKKEAEKLNAELKKVQKDIIDGLNDVKDTQKKYHELMVELQKAKKEFIENKEIHGKELEEAQPKIDELKKQVEKMQEGIDRDLLEIYNKKRKNAMPVIADIADKQCSGCFMELPSSIIENIKNSNEIVECENCGRILIFR